METVYNRKGFTIIELSIVLAVIMVIIALASGAYFGIISKSEDTAMIKMTTDDLPKAIQQYKMDVGIYPPKCENGSPRLKVLTHKNAVIGDGGSLTDARAQALWYGPYLKTGLNYSANGDILDENVTDAYYCWTSYTGVLGIFGRTADGGTDYVVRIVHSGEEASKTATRIVNKLGANKAKTTDSGNAAIAYVDVVFQQAY